ncbi:MAG TPA: DUF2911 domain-containing protein, partial [Gemmatimonadaceae bacterium]|nr:DUF2911 domain-containing protein [Gemmatimonadaceae bacterium]
MSRPLAAACSLFAAFVVGACSNATSRVATDQLTASETTTSGGHKGAFVVTLGADTIVVERFSRAGNTYSVEQALRSPSVRLFHTHIELTPAGDVSTMSYMQHRIGATPDASLLAVTDVKVMRDSASLFGKRGDSTVVNRRVAVAAGSLPTLPSSYLGYELASMRLIASGRDSMQARLLGPNGPTGFAVKRAGRDSVFFVLDPTTIYRAHVDAQGRILHMHAPLTTFKIQLVRVPDADVTKAATSWSAAPAMGILSPPDSVITRVGAANVAIRYSRPSKRGRVVFGDSSVAMEPFGKVWRTGANEATRFTTDRELTIGNATVPAGSYTLWTQLDRGAWTLIVNKQLLRPDNSGRLLWGTMYDPQYDLVRVPMTMTTLTSPVEHMTIALEPADAGTATL